jgi:hypothetical protein
MIVAVALDLSEPPQQSPIFGHRALSQTCINGGFGGDIPVCKFNPRRSFLILAKFPPAGMGRFSQSGRRLDPGIDVGSVESARKSEKEGPEFKVSVNDVWGRRVVCGEVVASVRTFEVEGRKVLERRSDGCPITLRHCARTLMMLGFERLACYEVGIIRSIGSTTRPE